MSPCPSPIRRVKITGRGRAGLVSMVEREGVASGGRLRGTSLEPPALEAAFRASTLRDDGRTAALVVGLFLVVSSVYVANDLRWAAPAGLLPLTLAARAVFALAGNTVVVVGLRARSFRALDLALLVNFLVGACFTVISQASRPRDYFLPITENLIGVLIVLAVIPSRFAFQVVAAAAVSASAVIWIVAFRVPPPAPVVILVAFDLLVVNLGGAFVAWKLHRSRRLQFLALRDQSFVTERLRESEELFRTAFDNASIGKALTDLSGRFVRVNSALHEMLGYREGELEGREAFEVTHPDDCAASHQAGADMIAGQPSTRLSKRYLRKDGGVVFAEVALSLVRRPDGAPLHFVAGILDVTAQREREAALAASRRHLSELYEGLGDGIVLVDTDGRLHEPNGTFCRMLGYGAGEVAGLTYQEITPERWHEEEGRILAEASRRRATVVTYEKEYRRKDGTVFPVELRIFLRYDGDRMVGGWAIVRDITEARALRDQLAVASRLAALGTLVAGVAHEINNPLGGAIASHGFALEEARRLRDQARSGHPLDRREAVDRLDEIVEALGDADAGEKRVARIVKDLALLGGPDARRVPVSLPRVAEEALRWVPVELRARADVTFEDRGAPEVAASEGQLVQVLANLVSNGVRAVPADRRARVRIRTGPGSPGLAVLEVEDDGDGITPEVMRRMFDPFFTTREIGQGMGLGLAICHAIVTAHGGTISASSEPGHGATFRVELPVSSAETAPPGTSRCADPMP